MEENNKSVKNFSNKLPRLRFPGFEGAFKEKYISEVISVKSKKHNPENNPVNYTCIELESLSQDSGELLSTFDSKNQKSIKNVFNSGDVLFGKLRPYLKKYYLADFDGVCSSEIWVLKSSTLKSEYLYAYIQSNSFISLTEISSGSKMPRADWNLVSSSLISYPKNFNEQEKIGRLFGLINSRIHTQRKTIEQLETLMQGWFKAIFFQKMRLKNFNNNWEETSLEEICDFYRGSSLSKNDILENGVSKCVHYGELFTIYNAVINKVVSSTNKDGFKSKIGDILMPSSDVTPLGLATASTILKSDVVLGGDINILRPTSEVNSIFLSYLLNFEKKKIIDLVSGTTIKHIYIKDLKQIKISIPSFQEQTKIANFLSSIQEKIETEKAILAQLEIQKKFLLQNLFV